MQTSGYGIDDILIVPPLFEERVEGKTLIGS